jgi:hypothetical protein
MKKVKSISNTELFSGYAIGHPMKADDFFTFRLS